MVSEIWISCAIALSFALGMAVESGRGSTDDEKRERVTGIGGIFIKAQHPKKLAEWYQEHLGIPAQGSGADDNSARFHSFDWRERDQPEKSGLTVWALFPERTRYFEPSGASFMINYRVANLDRLLAQLRQEGVKVDDKVDVEANGRFGWAMDPEGNRVELWEPAAE